MAGKYRLDFLGIDGALKFSTYNFLSLDMVRSENEIGSMTLVLPINFSRRDLLVLDGRMIVNRQLPGGTSYVEGQTQWWIRRPVDENRSQRTITVTAFDNMELLRRRVIPYQPGSVMAEIWDTAEVAMKYVVNTNFGALATDTARDISQYLTVDADLNLGPIVKKTVSGLSVFDVLREFADISKQQGVYLIFDILNDPTDNNKFVFRVFQDVRGENRGVTSLNPVILSEKGGTFVDPTYSEDYTNEVNVVYAGGEGNTGQITTVELDQTRIDASPFNRREAYIQSSNADDITKLQTDARNALYKGQPKIILAGKASDNNRQQYGVHFNYGDIVAVEYNGKFYDCHLRTSHLSYGGGAETMDIYAKYESGA